MSITYTPAIEPVEGTPAKVTLVLDLDQACFLERLMAYHRMPSSYVAAMRALRPPSGMRSLYDDLRQVLHTAKSNADF